jgi:hypothetical protein
VGDRVRVEHLQGGTLQSQTDETTTSRHVMLSSAGGVITEMERMQADKYIIRYHKSPESAGVVVETGSWIGFRYRDSDWSFVKH